MKENLNSIKSVLDEKGLSQTWLSEKMNISRNAVNHLCGNRSQPSLKRLYEIAEILEVDVCRLLNSNTGVKVENGTKNYDPQRTHERLVNLLNQFYGVERFKVVPGILGIENFDKIDTQQLSSGVGLLVNSNNLAGGDVGNVDLYKLVEVYLMNEEKRTAINKLL